MRGKKIVTVSTTLPLILFLIWLKMSPKKMRNHENRGMNESAGLPEEENVIPFKIKEIGEIRRLRHIGLLVNV